MLLLMIERGLPIDMVLTADTGMEFPEMYRHWDRVEQYLYRERGLHLTSTPAHLDSRPSISIGRDTQLSA